MVNFESVAKCGYCEKINPSTNEFCDLCGVFLVFDKALCSNCKNELRRSGKKCKNCKTKVNKKPIRSDSNIDEIYKAEKEEFLEKFSVECREKGLAENLDEYLVLIKNKMIYYPTVRVYLSEESPEFLLKLYGASKTDNLSDRIRAIFEKLKLNINQHSPKARFELPGEVEKILKHLDIVPNLIAIRWDDYIYNRELLVKRIESEDEIEGKLTLPLKITLTQGVGTLDSLIDLTNNFRRGLETLMGGGDLSSFYKSGGENYVNKQFGFDTKVLKKEKELLEVFLKIINESYEELKDSYFT